MKTGVAQIIAIQKIVNCESILISLTNDRNDIVKENAYISLKGIKSKCCLEKAKREMKINKNKKVQKAIKKYLGI